MMKILTVEPGSTPAQRVTRADYRYRAVGENIAAGQLSPEAAVAYAVNSQSQMGAYWVRLFGRPQ